ncbi:MAG TPA: type III-B CRISPR module RAMP protein Cmr1 [Sulfurimonas sp. UBA12504]|nr:MAG TPA: type III-B CRISPR module RAMP protein Cmr1 [Sulfurimonas sp. UBA12504]
METITFTCQTITPMLMHGADGSTAELRPASIKGVLRFWWRAIHGNLPNIEALKKAEAEIFGSTEGRSSFTLRVIHNLTTANPKINPLPHKNGFTVNGYQANQTFEVVISGQNLEPIKNLFVLATTLGGFGQRSRRGFGSVQITKIDNVDFTSPKTEEEIKAKIDNTFKYTSQINYPYIQNIQVGKTYNDFESLLKTIGTASHTNNCNELGSISPRLASPIYVSVIQDGTYFRPVITTLKNTQSNNGNEKVTKYKEAIL